MIHIINFLNAYNQESVCEISSFERKYVFCRDGLMPNFPKPVLSSSFNFRASVYILSYCPKEIPIVKQQLHLNCSSEVQDTPLLPWFWDNKLVTILFWRETWEQTRLRVFNARLFFYGLRCFIGTLYRKERLLSYQLFLRQ